MGVVSDTGLSRLAVDDVAPQSCLCVCVFVCVCVCVIRSQTHSSLKFCSSSSALVVTLVRLGTTSVQDLLHLVFGCLEQRHLPANERDS